jgi:hypothetical protein
VFLYALIHAGRHVTEGDSMSLKEQITEDMKAAMRAKDSGRLATIRLLTAAIKQKEVDERIDVSDEQVLAIIEKMNKQRKDSISQFEAGGRQDLADIEKAELAILSTYMPAAKSTTIKVGRPFVSPATPSVRTIASRSLASPTRNTFHPYPK